MVIGARDLKKGREVREDILKDTPNAEVVLLEIDLSSFASVQRFCLEFLALHIPLNILMYVSDLAVNSKHIIGIIYS